MIKPLQGEEIGSHIGNVLPHAVVTWKDLDLWIHPEFIEDTCRFLRDSVELKFNFLNSISAVDYIDHFEVIYHITSTDSQKSIVLKTKIFDRENPYLHSVIDIWKGADLQEREIWDLMGIYFQDHPNMKRLLLWEGFDGYPLRKDYLESAS